LFDEGGAGEQVDVGVEDERHHRHHAAIASGVEANPEAQPVPEQCLDRTGKVEEAEKREPDHVGRHGERQDEGPLEKGAPGESIVDDQPGQRGPQDEAAQAHSDQQEDRVDKQLGELGAEEMSPDVDGGLGQRREHRRDRHGQDGDDADRDDRPGRSYL
jgi:hypothetical protein